MPPDVESKPTDVCEDAPVAHLAVDRDGRVAAANAACAATFGRSKRDLVGRPVASLFAAGATGTEQLQRVLECRASSGDEIALARGDGSEHWGQIFAWPRGEILQLIVLDITEARRRRIELEISEAHLRMLGKCAPVMLWLSGPDGRCTLFNDRWLEFTGRTLEAELGEGWIDDIHLEDVSACLHTYMTAFAQRCEFRMEYRLRRADGAFRWVLDTGVPRFEPDGTFAGYIGSCIDVTDFKAELEGRIAEAREAIAARDEFLSIASHELRTPLTALVLQLAGLQRRLHDPAHQSANGIEADKIDKAVRATGRLTTLIDNLLDVSRIATGRLQLELEDCDLAEVARELIERVTDTARRAGCELTCHIEPSIRGTWDRGRLEQILDNLVSNAIKYGPGKPIVVTVTSTADRARVAVRDHGIGISKVDVERIFDRFERAVPARHYAGLGLGLYITRQIVAAHQGTIDVISEPGAGAEFVVDIPRWREARARSQAVQEAVQS